MSNSDDSTNVSVYDRNDYYNATKGGVRLNRFFDLLLLVSDRLKALSIRRQLRLSFGAKVLDVGSGDGSFIAALRSSGLRVFGTTASLISQQTAGNKYQIELEYTKTIDQLGVYGPDELITYWHVFEHLDTPNEHIDQWHRLLAPGGSIVIEVPNVSSFGSRLCYGSWLGSDERHHINHQSPDLIRQTLQKAGLRVYREQFFSVKFSYVFMWSAILGYLFGAKHYHFDNIMLCLKNPLQRLRRAPFATINLFCSVFYLAPIVLSGLIWERLNGSGEIYRVYARRA